MSTGLGKWTIPECACITFLGSITKYHRLGGLNNRNLFSHSSIGWKSKIRISSGLVSSEISVWLDDGCFSPCFFTCLSVFQSPFLARTLVISDERPLTWSPIIFTSLKTYLQIQLCSEVLEVRTPTYESGEGTQLNCPPLPGPPQHQSLIQPHWALLATSLGLFPHDLPH